MKKTFLGEVAGSLYAKFGDGISELNVVFPNKRARLFFERELSRLIGKPIWQPNYETIDNLVKTHSGIELAHNLKLIAVLYNIYQEVTNEEVSFDKFYSFGEILLADFDTIDKYLVNPKKIFQNISELGTIDDLFEVNSEERDIIESFWKNYNASGGEHAKRFSKIWRHLHDIYERFNGELDALKVGYSGKIYRSATRNFSHADLGDYPTFIFVGFNALNSCEKTIFKHLQNNEKALFYWDCDRYYLNNVEQEAGLFLRRNIALFGEGEIEPTREFRNNKRIEIVKVPSEILQAKVLHDYLENPSIDQSETAVILTNENLLPVVISFIPKQIDKLNITMGGQIGHSVPFVLFERIVRAQRRRDNGRYHLGDITAICSHPLIRSVSPFPTEMIENFRSQGIVYLNCDEIGLEQLKTIFTEGEIDGSNIGNYLLDTVKEFCFIDDATDFGAKENNEYSAAIVESIERINNIVVQSGIVVSVAIYMNLLHRVINSARVAYIGEPLDGMQMMGILESRCIDFKNVFVLSITDETFPSSRAVNSFIPHNLRRGFGLPTQTEHAAVWAYYFYRLIQRAENVTLMYAATTETMGVSEPSRYIYQLEYESGQNIVHTNIELNVNKQAPVAMLSEPKSEQVLQQLKNMRFSPSRINDFVDCPLRFYYKHIKNIRIERPIEQIDSIDTGNILHTVLEEIYKPLKSNVLESLRGLTSDMIVDYVNRSCDVVLGKRIEQPAIANSIDSLKELICKYVRIVVDFDIAEGVLVEVVETERELNYDLDVDGQIVKLYGKADRVDRLNDGSIRVVDYKSGRDRQDFENVESLFIADKGRNKAALQTLTYSLMSGGVAAIYSVKKMGEDDFSPYLRCKESGEIVDGSSGEVMAMFRDGLSGVLGRVLSGESFFQSPDLNSCSYCDFDFICRRQS